jgi:hypothetical protein
VNLKRNGAAVGCGPRPGAGRTAFGSRSQLQREPGAGNRNLQKDRWLQAWPLIPNLSSNPSAGSFILTARPAQLLAIQTLPQNFGQNVPDPGRATGTSRPRGGEIDNHLSIRHRSRVPAGRFPLRLAARCQLPLGKCAVCPAPRSHTDFKSKSTVTEPGELRLREPGSGQRQCPPCRPGYHEYKINKLLGSEPPGPWPDSLPSSAQYRGSNRHWDSRTTTTQ